MMTADRLSRMSFGSGLGIVACFALALVLMAIYPPAPGHRSAMFSEAGILLFLLSAISFVLAPTALVTGVKALRRFPAEAGKLGKIKAWIGVIVGGFYSTIMAIPFVVLPWLQLEPNAAPHPSVVGIYQNEKKPEDTTELRADGTFVVKERSLSFTGKYRVNGRDLTLVLPDGETVVGSIQDGVLIDAGGQRLVKQ